MAECEQILNDIQADLSIMNPCNMEIDNPTQNTLSKSILSRKRSSFRCGPFNPRSVLKNVNNLQKNDNYTLHESKIASTLSIDKLDSYKEVANNDDVKKPKSTLKKTSSVIAINNNYLSVHDLTMNSVKLDNVTLSKSLKSTNNIDIPNFSFTRQFSADSEKVVSLSKHSSVVSISNDPCLVLEVEPVEVQEVKKELIDVKYIDELAFYSGYCRKHRVETQNTLNIFLSFCQTFSYIDSFLIENSSTVGCKWTDHNFIKVVNNYIVRKTTTKDSFESTIFKNCWSLNHVIFSESSLNFLKQHLDGDKNLNLLKFILSVLDLKFGPLNGYEERFREIFRYYIEEGSIYQISISKLFLDEILLTRSIFTVSFKASVKSFDRAYIESFMLVQKFLISLKNLELNYRDRMKTESAAGLERSFTANLFKGLILKKAKFSKKSLEIELNGGCAEQISKTNDLKSSKEALNCVNLMVNYNHNQQLDQLNEDSIHCPNHITINYNNNEKTDKKDDNNNNNVDNKKDDDIEDNDKTNIDNIIDKDDEKYNNNNSNNNNNNKVIINVDNNNDNNNNNNDDDDDNNDDDNNNKIMPTLPFANDHPNVYVLPNSNSNSNPSTQIVRVPPTRKPSTSKIVGRKNSILKATFKNILKFKFKDGALPEMDINSNKSKRSLSTYMKNGLKRTTLFKSVNRPEIPESS